MGVAAASVARQRASREGYSFLTLVVISAPLMSPFMTSIRVSGPACEVRLPQKSHVTTHVRGLLCGPGARQPASPVDSSHCMLDQIPYNCSRASLSACGVLV